MYLATFGLAQLSNSQWFSNFGQKSDLILLKSDHFVCIRLRTLAGSAARLLVLPLLLVIPAVPTVQLDVPVIRNTALEVIPLDPPRHERRRTDAPSE